MALKQLNCERCDGEGLLHRESDCQDYLGDYVAKECPDCVPRRLKVEQHFVTFYSPGTLVAEQDAQEIDSWDVEEAQKRAKKIRQRYGAIPYAFRFSTRSHGPDDLDSKVSEHSPTYYLNCKVETLADLEERNDPKEKILRQNMKSNKWDRIVTTTKGWKWTQPLQDDDIVLT